LHNFKKSDVARKFRKFQIFFFFGREFLLKNLKTALLTMENHFQKNMTGSMRLRGKI